MECAEVASEGHVCCACVRESPQPVRRAEAARGCGAREWYCCEVNTRLVWCRLELYAVRAGVSRGFGGGRYTSQVKSRCQTRPPSARAQRVRT